MNRCVVRNAYLLARSDEPVEATARRVVARCGAEIAREAQTLEALVDAQLATPRQARPGPASPDVVSTETAKALDQASARIAEARVYRCWTTLEPTGR